MEIVLHRTSSSTVPQQPASTPIALCSSLSPVLPEGDALRHCRTCQKPETAGLKLKKCSNCTNALYCSSKCQKADWSQHKAACRAGPPAQQEKLAQYGYTSAAAFSRDIRDYANAHSWAVRNLVMTKRQIWRDTHPNTPIREQPRIITFRLRCQTTPDSHKNRNPATRFAVVGEPTLGDLDQWIRDCPRWWAQSLEGRAEVEQKYVREHGSEYLGVLSIEYFVPETNSCTNDFLPILEPNCVDPDPHLRRPLFDDMVQFSIKSMNCGFPLRMSDESGQVATPGRFVRVEKSWQWKPFFNSWDEYSPDQERDAAYRELDLAISSRTFFHGSMHDLMKTQAWFCTM